MGITSGGVSFGMGVSHNDEESRWSPEGPSRGRRSSVGRAGTPGGGHLVVSSVALRLRRTPCVGSFLHLVVGTARAGEKRNSYTCHGSAHVAPPKRTSKSTGPQTTYCPGCVSVVLMGPAWRTRRCVEIASRTRCGETISAAFELCVEVCRCAGGSGPAAERTPTALSIDFEDGPLVESEERCVEVVSQVPKRSSSGGEEETSP